MTRVLNYLRNTDDEGSGYCEYGHYNIIPACTAIIPNNKLYCFTCENYHSRKTLIFEVVNIVSVR